MSADIQARTDEAFFWAAFVAKDARAVPFGALAKGERFVFRVGTTVGTKTGIGRYRMVNAEGVERTWKTGQRTAVIPLD